jgi:hypothetical protein
MELSGALRSQWVAKLAVGDSFLSAQLQDIDGVSGGFPAVFANAPAHEHARPFFDF